MAETTSGCANADRVIRPKFRVQGYDSRIWIAMTRRKSQPAVVEIGRPVSPARHLLYVSLLAASYPFLWKIRQSSLDALLFKQAFAFYPFPSFPFSLQENTTVLKAVFRHSSCPFFVCALFCAHVLLSCESCIRSLLPRFIAVTQNFMPTVSCGLLTGIYRFPCVCIGGLALCQTVTACLVIFGIAR